jgi:hypothetical protein
MAINKFIEADKKTKKEATCSKEHLCLEPDYLGRNHNRMQCLWNYRSRTYCNGKALHYSMVMTQLVTFQRKTKQLIYIHIFLY